MAEADSFLEIITQLEKITEAEQFNSLVSDIRSAYRLQNIVYRAPFVPGRSEADPLLFLTYDTRWVAEYFKEDYSRVDPIEAHVANAAAPVDWDNVDKTSTAEIRHFFKEANKHSVGRRGISIPVRHPNGAYGVFTFTSNASEREWETEKRRKLPELNLVASYFHRRIIELSAPMRWGRGDSVPLSARELRLLELIAAGFEVKQIANILGLSQTTIRNDMRYAGLKLGCTNPNHAVTTAIFRGLIRAGEIKLST